MNIRKTILSTLLLLCLILHMLPVIAPVEASAFGYRGISQVDISFSMPPVQAADVAALSVSTGTRGCYIDSAVWYDIYGQPITNKFPNSNATVEIVLKASSGYSFNGDVVVNIGGAPAARDNYGSELHISATYSPVIWAPSMVKHPSDETVYEGEVASFVSYSSCTDKSSWQVLDTDGTVYSAEAFAEKFPDLFVDISFDKLNISPVPMELNGYKVRCCFTGPGGDVNSNYAKITVEKEAVPTAEPSAAGVQSTPVPTPAHEHVFSSELSHDAGYHWYGCACGETKDRTEHNYKWTQVNPATLDKQGLVQGECSVCGFILIASTELSAVAAAEAEAEKEAEETPAAGTVEPSPAATAYAVPIEERMGFFERIRSLFR